LVIFIELDEDSILEQKKLELEELAAERTKTIRYLISLKKHIAIYVPVNRHLLAVDLM